MLTGHCAYLYVAWPFMLFGSLLPVVAAMYEIYTTLTDILYEEND